MKEGYEVEWVSGYNPPADTPIGDFVSDACIYSFRDFDALCKARAFARRVRHKAIVINVAWINQFREQPDEYIPNRIERIYIGDTEEFS